MIIKLQQLALFMFGLSYVLENFKMEEILFEESLKKWKNCYRRKLPAVLCNMIVDTESQIVPTCSN